MEKQHQLNFSFGSSSDLPHTYARLPVASCYPHVSARQSSLRAEHRSFNFVSAHLRSCRINLRPIAGKTPRGLIRQREHCYRLLVHCRRTARRT